MIANHKLEALGRQATADQAMLLAIAHGALAYKIESRAVPTSFEGWHEGLQICTRPPEDGEFMRGCHEGSGLACHTVLGLTTRQASEYFRLRILAENTYTGFALRERNCETAPPTHPCVVPGNSYSPWTLMWWKRTTFLWFHAFGQRMGV